MTQYVSPTVFDWQGAEALSAELARFAEVPSFEAGRSRPMAVDRPAADHEAAVFLLLPGQGAAHAGSPLDGMALHRVDLDDRALSDAALGAVRRMIGQADQAAIEAGGALALRSDWRQVEIGWGGRLVRGLAAFAARASRRGGRLLLEVALMILAPL